MKKILKLRTKIEAAFAVGIVISLVMVGISWGSRTITSDSDTLYTQVWNSNGNTWPVSGANIQAAMDDIGSYGTVWVGSDVTLSSELVFDSSGVIVDFLGNQVTLSGNIGFANFTTQYGACYHNELKNAYVRPSTSCTKGIITMCVYNKAYPSQYWSHQVRFNRVENIDIYCEWSMAHHNYTGIDITLQGDSDVCFNTFRDMTIWGCRNGILLESYHSGAYGNDNEFDNILIYGYVNGSAWIDSYGDSFGHNIFRDIRLQTIGTSLNPSSGYTEPTYGFYNVSGGQVFSDNLVWDTGSADDFQYIYWLGPDAMGNQIKDASQHKFAAPYFRNDGDTLLSFQSGAYFISQTFEATYPPSLMGAYAFFVHYDTDDNRYYLCYFNESGIRKRVELS